MLIFIALTHTNNIFFSVEAITVNDLVFYKNNQYANSLFFSDIVFKMSTQEGTGIQLFWTDGVQNIPFDVCRAGWLPIFSNITILTFIFFNEIYKSQ